MRKSLGMVLLSVWLILHGVIALTGLAFAGQNVVMGVLALAAGVLILVNR